MKNICSLLFSIFLLSHFAFAKSPIKLVYVGSSVASSIDRAVYNGARDALIELKGRYGKDFKLEFINSLDETSQLVELGKAYIDGAKGAILFPASSFGDYSKNIDEFVEKKFPITFVGRDIPKSKSLCYVGGDESQMCVLARSELKRLMNGEKKSIFIYAREDSSLDSVTKYCDNLFGLELLKSLSAQSKPRVELMALYSIYSTINSISIMRRDDYAEIFTTPDLLSDTTPIKRDGDRAFAMCIGALPSLTRYLERGELASCVYHDYYGWGYFAARALAEKIMDNTTPTSRVRLLKPLRATPENAESFRRDWHNWTK